MALEIERKWLISPGDVPSLINVEGVYIEQAYALDADGVILRIRSAAGPGRYGNNAGFVTVKSPSMVAGAVSEFEMEIPYNEACTLIAACERKLTKTRYRLPAGDLVIELDIFYDGLRPLIVAEVEFPENYSDPFTSPRWFGREVTGVRGYSNASLIKYGLPVDFQP